MNQKKLWNSIEFLLKHFILRFGNLPFELYLPSKEFSRKLFTLEFAELLLERSSKILISFSFESIWKILYLKKVSWMFSLMSLALSISLQIFCSSLRPSNISPSSFCKSDIFSSRVLFTDSNLWMLPSSYKSPTELFTLVTKLGWPTL